MEILAVAIRLFTDADAALPPEHALHIGHELHRLVEEALLFQLIIERETRRTRPKASVQR